MRSVSQLNSLMSCMNILSVAKVIMPLKILSNKWSESVESDTESPETY